MNDVTYKEVEVEAYSTKLDKLGIKDAGSGEWWNFDAAKSEKSRQELADKLGRTNPKDESILLVVSNRDGRMYVDFEYDGDSDDSVQSSISGGGQSQNGSKGRGSERFSDFVTFDEKLDKAHNQLGEFSIVTDMVRFDFEKNKALVKAVVNVGEQQFHAYGEATPSNTQVDDAIPRVAETRAKSRALKDALGLTMNGEEK